MDLWINVPRIKELNFGFEKLMNTRNGQGMYRTHDMNSSLCFNDCRNYKELNK